MPIYTLIWLLAGSVLCLMELFFPSAFIEFMMGISALIVALLSQFGLTSLWLQVVAWLLLSTLLIVLSRRFLQPRRRKSKIQDAIVAETLTEIPAGKTGRVLYEGNSWRAQCDDDKLSVAAYERVYVVRREGTTLIVMPENLLSSQ
ncbi:membrane protein implicated in regulation of membrane protease activity [Nostoc sp. PCC 7524]|uniref:NfeD family protein n=1 Tax=Nostoc sp. (strain ATCC 29411 / PCC 7524) TaxID=28072 RepID=UPI00029F2416|nr:NfeD family protein [Nostoc sp. PCC 7524]AFY45974.1 membrane protein implicated in regulation of membrane protease activity [Nostoc sp. PCC 7524]